MTSTTDQAADTGTPEDGGEPLEGKTALGRALDVAGVVAACALAVIMFDVLSGGKVTRFIQRRIAGKRGGQPCEGCDDDVPVQAAPEVAGDN